LFFHHQRIISPGWVVGLVLGLSCVALVGCGSPNDNEPPAPCPEPSSPPALTEVEAQYGYEPLPEIVGGTIPVPSTFQLTSLWIRRGAPLKPVVAEQAIRFVSETQLDRFDTNSAEAWTWRVEKNGTTLTAERNCILPDSEHVDQTIFYDYSYADGVLTILDFSQDDPQVSTFTRLSD
jgi:hypothetical protein